MREHYERRTLGLAAAALALLCACARDAEKAVTERWAGDPASVSAPAPDPLAMGRPLFREFGSDILRGTAFIMDWEGRPYLVSCYHVFGGGDARVPLMRQAEVLAEASGRLPVPGRMGTFSGDCDASGEITIIPVTRLNAASKPLRLAAAPPRPGQPLWLFKMSWQDEVERQAEGLTQFSPGSFETGLVKGTAVRSSDRALELAYAEFPSIDMTSGAPVLDQDGNVAGINVGFCRRGGALTGLAAPQQALAEAFRRYAGR